MSLAVILTCFQGPVRGTDIAYLKLTGHWAHPPIGYRIGDGSVGGPSSLASNENWIVAGAPGSADQITAQGGAVQVFNALTGAFVHELLPPLVPPVQPGTFYGSSCAVSGNTAVIGAPGPLGSSPGAAYVYNLTTGLLLHTLHPVAPGLGVNGDYFGAAVAISGNRVIVGAYANAGATGRAYIYDLTTGVQLAVISAPGGVPGDRFGYAIAAEGNVAIIAAPFVDALRGAVYAFDLTTFAYITKFQPAASAAGDWAGSSVAMHQGKMILGAPHANFANLSTMGAGQIYVMGMLDGVETTLTASDVVANAGQSYFLGSCVATHQGLLVAGSSGQAGNRGAIYLYDLNSASTTEFQKLIPPDGGLTEYGSTVSICGNQAVTTAPLDSTENNQAGAVCLMSPILRPMPMTKVTAKGDFAPGVNESNFLAIGDAFLNSDGEVAFSSTCTGTPGGTGIWNTLAPNQPLDLVLKAHQLDSGLTVSSVSNPLVNDAGTSIFQGLFTLGGSVTVFNNQAVYKDNGTAVTRILRSGDPVPAFGNAKPVSFTPLVQSQFVNRVAAIPALQLFTGSPATTAASDSGLLWYDVGSSSIGDTQREGATETASGLVYGQFAPRLAAYWNNVVYSTAIASPTPAAFNQAVFQKVYTGAVTKVAQKGFPADSVVPTTNYFNFIGESSDDGERVLYRATLSAPATVFNNEGLWLYTPGSPAIHSLVVRKGSIVFGLPGVTIASFINYWQSGGSTLALVSFTGSGINNANNHALILYSNSAAIPPLVLMRTGDPAPGCGAAKIGTIARVELEPKNAHYLVLATLTGAPSGTELALFRGFANKFAGSLFEQVTFRRPVPVLRKGQLFLNQPGKITSISLPATNLTASGAGNTGLGVTMRLSVNANTPNTAVIAVDFANGVHQVMKGIP